MQNGFLFGLVSMLTVACVTAADTGVGEGLDMVDLNVCDFGAVPDDDLLAGVQAKLVTLAAKS